MAKKLTLNIDDELISFAYAYAKQNGESISRLFERYFACIKTIVKKQAMNHKTLHLYGLFLGCSNISIDEARLRNYLVSPLADYDDTIFAVLTILLYDLLFMQSLLH